MQIIQNNPAKQFTVFEQSVNHIDGSSVFMARFGLEDYLVADKKLGFTGDSFSHERKDMIKAELNHENACTLRRLFPYTAPEPVLERDRTFGLGDRLGNATAGHIQTIRKFGNITPVLAQQSKRELNLTNRTFASVLDDVSFAVFRCGYRDGFGADGDHLKTEAEVKEALESGFRMITLDCSEFIMNEVYDLSDDDVEVRYIPDPTLESIYFGETIQISDDITLKFEQIEFKRMCLIFSEAIKFAHKIYCDLIESSNYKVDFEISIDETSYSTTPNQHFFVANELIRRGVKFATLAPRFCGDFQKGIEYIGDLEQFEKEFKLHARIADHLKYKISVHSGSDKFSVYPIVKRLTQGKFHIKTSGTSWLVAMKSICLLDPTLFRQIHEYALTVYDEALKYYHITSDFTKIPNIDNLADKALPDLMENESERQLIHICYGLILNHKDKKGDFVFRDRLYKIWKESEPFYFENLEAHIGKHLSLVC